MSPHRTPGDLGPGPTPEPPKPKKRVRLTKVATHTLTGILFALAVGIGGTWAIVEHAKEAQAALICLLLTFGVGLAFGAGYLLSATTNGWDRNWFLEEEP